MIIWALTDSRIGNNKQTLALAEKLGKHRAVKVKYTVLAKLPSFGSSGFKIRKQKTKPDLIIATGRKLANVAWHLKKKYKCKVIQIMNPGKKLVKKFEHVIIPEHDHVADAPNIIKITGAVCANKVYEKPHNTTRNIAVLVGNITAAESLELVDRINLNAGFFMITTSRRTNEEAVYVIESKISQLHQLYKYGSEAPNPYNEFIEKADIIIVTGDSANMVSEAAHTGKPVYILEVETKEKFKRFWAELYAKDIARPLSMQLETWEYEPLNNLGIIMQRLATSL